MVSRRNYITITIMILILLFMFQFIGVMKEALNEYGLNEYNETSDTHLRKDDMYKVKHKKASEILSSDREYVIYIGDENEDEIGNVVSWWCTYSKRNLLCYKSLRKCRVSDDNPPKAVILDGEAFGFGKEETDILYDLVRHKINIIFARLPEKEVIVSNEKLKRMFGIRTIAVDNVNLKGMHLFGGFLLGGEAIYEPADEEEAEKRQDLELNVPWYVTGEGTKTYVMGTIDQGNALTEDEKIKNETLPAIIWRNSIDRAQVFCVNGDYLTQIAGMGFLTAMMSEISDYEIYPVINARNLIIADYPGFADENYDEINKRYSQSLEAVLRDIVWPTLASMASRTDNKLSLMMTPQFDYSDKNEPTGSNVVFYLKLLKEMYSEAGISLDTVSATQVSDKLLYDKNFWNTNAPDYSFRAAFTNDMTRADELSKSDYGYNIKSVILGHADEAEGIVSYIDDDITMQKETSDGVTHTYTDDIMLKSMETALGYSNIVIDFERIVYPQDDEDSWENFAKEMTSTVGTYWKAFSAFDGTAVSESDKRIRRFLSADYTKKQMKDGVSLDISGLDSQAWFILKINDKEIVSVDGGSFEEIEKNVYLIDVSEEHVEIKWKEKSEQGLFYFGE